MKLRSVYNTTTGLFTGGRCSGTLLLPDGVASVEGEFDPLSQRVDVSSQKPADAPDDWTPPVIDYQPPAPANDAWQTWAWDAGIKRWVSSPTLAAIKRDRRQIMAAAWDEARRAGVAVGTKVAPTDADAWTRYLAIQAMATDASAWVDVPIQLLDGSFELLTKPKAGALWTALKDMERTLLARLRARVESIAAATTAAEVSAIVW